MYLRVFVCVRVCTYVCMYLYIDIHICVFTYIGGTHLFINIYTAITVFDSHPLPSLIQRMYMIYKCICTLNLS